MLFYFLISVFQASSRTPKKRTFRALSIDIENSSFHAMWLGIENLPSHKHRFATTAGLGFNPPHQRLDAGFNPGGRGGGLNPSSAVVGVGGVEVRLKPYPHPGGQVAGRSTCCYTRNKPIHRKENIVSTQGLIV